MFYAINGERIKQFFIIILAALFSAILLYVETRDVEVLTQFSEPRAVDSVQTKEKIIALTFNISWGDKYALQIVDTLKKYDLNKTTFFLSGSWAERHPDIVERIIEDGHEVGNLGFHYDHYTNLEDDQIRKDLQLSTHVLNELTKEKPTLFRPPHGSFDSRVLSLIHDFNYTVVHWSVDSHDWKNPGTDAIVENVTKHAKSGDIILMHASDSAKQTAKALPAIIEHFQKKGYRFATVSELVADSNVETKEIK